MKRAIFAALLLLGVTAFTYEDNTHQKLTQRAIEVAVSQGGLPADFFAPGEKQSIIAGAGLHGVGEDYTGYLKIGQCNKRTFRFWNPAEVLNHFKGGLLMGGPAYTSFVRFYGDAVDLWNSGNKADAAFTLGRALHLIEDMAQPQHAMDEKHCHLPWFHWNNPSFLEEFTEANIGNAPATSYCANSRNDYGSRIAGISRYDGTALWELTLLNMQETGEYVGKDFLNGSFTSNALQAAYGPEGAMQCSSSGHCLQLALPFQFGPESGGVHCGTVLYTPGLDWEPLGLQSGTYKRVDMAMKVAQGIADENGTGSFEDTHVQYLLAPAVSNGASLIAAFWNEVKDVNPNQKPCTPPSPAGDHPDDSAQVKSSVVAAHSTTPASSDWHNICRVGIGKGLPTMADYGVSSSLMDQLFALDPNSDPSVAEALYARLESLEAKYSGPRNVMPQEVEQAPFVAVWEKGFGGSARSLVESFNEPVKMLEEPQEPVFTDEQSLAALPPKRGLLDADASKQKVLILPTGSLYGLRADSVEHSALQSYVEQGGVVVCFTQAYGDDFSALPVPDGEELLAAGYKQDVSCFSGSAYPAMDHPVLSGITTLQMGCNGGACGMRPGITAGMDGFFRKVPINATVLLRRTISGEPCLILYPVGQGCVVASTMYEDWGYANGQSTKDGRSILANILSLAKAPAQTIPVTNLSAGGSASSIQLALNVRNLSGTPADQIEIVVMSPDRKTQVAQVFQSVSISANSEVDVPVALDLSSYFTQASAQYGIFHADYRLLALNPTSGQEEEIQPQGEAVTGRFVVEMPDTTLQSLSHTVFSVWTDSDIAGDAGGVVHLHLADLTGTARNLHLWEAFNHEYGHLVQTIALPASGTLDLDLARDLTRGGTYRYFVTDAVYGLSSYLGQWACLYGFDPWKVASMGAVYLRGNFNGGLVRVWTITGLQTIPYEPNGTATGTVRLANPRSVAEDVTVAFSLLAAGQVNTYSQVVHLEPGVTLPVDFSLALPGPITYYKSGIVSVNVSLGPSIVAGTSQQIAVDGWSPDLALTPVWPSPQTLASLNAPLVVHIANQAGPRVADAKGCILKASVWDLTSYAMVEEQSLPVPLLHPGEEADLTFRWSQWQPATGKRYMVRFSLVDSNSNVIPGPFIGKDFASDSPALACSSGRSVAGEASVMLEGQLVNGGDLNWEGQLAWDCQALGASHSQAVTIAPKSTAPFSWGVPRPDSLAPGIYPYSMTLMAAGLTAPVTAQGTIEIKAPALCLAWPETPPTFRHDQNVSLPVSLTVSEAATPLAATVDATMSWGGGSSQVAAGLPLTLDPVQPVAFSLPLPMARMTAPGGFSVSVTTHVAQGNITQTWNASYELKGPDYAGGFSTLTAAPGESLAGQIQNTGAFEGNAQVNWTLTDARGVVVAADEQALSAGIGATVPIAETLPQTLLPGMYQSTLTVSDGASSAARSFSQAVTVTGVRPVLTLSTDRSVYGTADPVALTLHVEDSAHSLEGASTHFEIQRYIGKAGAGGTQGPPGASWNTPTGNGSGNYVVNPSSWFLDSAGTPAAYVSDVSAELPSSGIPPVAADVNGDGKADFITIESVQFGNGLPEPTLIIASEGDLGSGFAKPAVKRPASKARTKKPIVAEGNGCAARSNAASSARQVFDPGWLYVPVAATWGQPADVWDGYFMLGVRGDGSWSANALCMGMSDSKAGTATVLMAKLDGTVLWRHDFPAPFTPYCLGGCNTLSAAGPVFVDLNGDGVKDILFRSADMLFALNGQTGQTLWTYPLLGTWSSTYRVGYALTGPNIWIAANQETGDTLTLLDKDGHAQYQAAPAGGLSPESLVTGDVDGDGNDEAVIAQAWQDGQRTVEVFSVSSPAPLATTATPDSFVSLVDINGDGRAEALLAIQGQNPDGSVLLIAEAVDLLGGTTLWATPMPATAPGSSGSFITYMDGRGGINLLFETPRTEAGPSIFCLMSPTSGTIGQILEQGGYWSGDILAADFDGDGVSEFYAGGALLDNGCLGPGGVAGPCAEWETVWQTDDWLSESGENTLDVSYEAGAMATPGTYRAVASATTATGQALDINPAGFSVVITTLGLSLAPSADTTIRTDEALNGTVSLINTGDAAEMSISVTLLVDNQEFASWSIDSLEPQAHRELAYTLPPAPAGKHAMEIHAIENGAIVSDITSAYISATPQVEITLDAPSSHTEESFTFTATAANTSLVPAHIAFILSDDPGHPVNLTLQPQETAPVTFTRQITSDYSAQITVLGDAQETLPVTIPSGYQLGISIPDLGPQLAGAVSVPVHIRQNGSATYSGSLTATLIQLGSTISISTWPVQVSARGDLDIVLPLQITAPGAASIHVSATRTQATADKDLLIYEGGIGTLAISIPQTLGEGATAIPFTVQNGLAVQGNFDIQLIWNEGGSPQQVAGASLSVSGSGIGSGILQPTLPIGTGTLQAMLNGVLVTYQSVTVLPAIRAGLALTLSQPQDGPPMVTATIEDTGYAAMDASLEFRGDSAASQIVHVEPGTEQQRTFLINPDGFGGSEAPVSAILHVPDGTVEEKSLTISLRPPQLEVTPPQTPIQMVPGETAQLAFGVTNAGDLSAHISVAVEFANGEQERFVVEGSAPGHGDESLAVPVPLPWDIPNGDGNAHYIVTDADRPDIMIAEGDLPVIIQGPTVAASASLDAAAYPVGSSATMSVSLSLAPPGAQPREVLVRILGGNYEEERPVTVSSTHNETFAIPVTNEMDGVSVEVLQPGGRSIYINRFRVYPMGQGFVIHPDKSVYQTGESVQLSAILPSQGSLHLNFMGQDVTLQGGGTLNRSFAIPSDASEDSYTVAYDYTPTDATASPASGGIMVDVHGILVTGGESHLDKTIFAPSENVSGQIVLYANQTFSGTLKFWLAEPDGSYGYGGDQAVTLAQGTTPSRFPFSLPFATNQAGTHRVAFSLVGASGAVYTDGSLPFRVGNGTILGVAPSQSSYPQGVEPVSLLLRTAGKGMATATIQLDGNETAQASISMDGTNTTSVALGPVPPGEHAAKVTLVDALGLASEARCRFTYGAGLPDLRSSVSAGCRSDGLIPIWIRITNAGSGGAGASAASLYDGNPGAGGILLASLPVPALGTGEEYNFTYDWSVAGQEGPHEIYFVADAQSSIMEWDETNNVSSTSATVAQPVFIQVTPPDSTCAKDAITPAISISPAGTPFAAMLNGQPYAPGTPIALEGDYQFTATCLTSCGTSAATAQLNYVIDRTPPNIQISGVEDGAVYTASVSAAFQANDLHLGSVNATLNGAPFSSGSTISAPGDYILAITATDCAGN